MSKRTIRLRELAEQYNGTGFEINMSDVSVLFRPGDERGIQFARAVTAEYGRSVVIRRTERDGWERFALSLG